MAETHDRGEIHIRADFMIEEGKIEEFKKLIQDISKTGRKIARYDKVSVLS